LTENTLVYGGNFALAKLTLRATSLSGEEKVSLGVEIMRSHHHCHYFKIEFVSPKRLITLTLNLPPELEQYLLQEANKQGLSVEAVTLQVLTNRLCDGVTAQHS
jgi:hypothetical protein